MAMKKKKLYFSPPTYKQINSILNKGYKLTSINSSLCNRGNVVSVGKSKRFSFSFEKCDDTEKYYCLQQFLLSELFSEKEYNRIVEEIREYQKQGAYIMSSWHIKKDKSEALRDDLLQDTSLNDTVKSNIITFLKEEHDMLYYIIVPKETVREADEERSYKAMLKFLGFKIYANIDSWWLLIFIFFILSIIEVLAIGIRSPYILQAINLGVLFFYICFNIPNYYYFFRYRLYRKEYSFRHFLRERNREEKVRRKMSSTEN